MKRRFTVMETLCVTAIGVVLLSGAMSATGRLMRFQRQQIALAWAVQEEALIAKQWRAYVASLPADGVQVSDDHVSAPQNSAYTKSDLLIMGKWQRLLPKGTTVRFAESADAPQLLILTLTHGTTGETLRFVGHRPRGTP